MEKNKKTIFDRVEELEKSFDRLVDTLAEELFPSEAPRNPNYLFKVVWSDRDITHILLDFNTLKSIAMINREVTIEDVLNDKKIVNFGEQEDAKAAVNNLEKAWRKWING